MHFNSEWSHFKCSIATCVKYPILDTAVRYCSDVSSHPLLNPLLNHSTETGHVKVSNNLNFTLSRGQFLASVLPDLPATCNPVDHAFLFAKLPSLGLQDTTLGFPFASLVVALQSLLLLYSHLYVL